MSPLDWAGADSRLRLGDRELGASLMLRSVSTKVTPQNNDRIHLFDHPAFLGATRDRWSICGRIREEYTRVFGRYLLADAYAIDPTRFCRRCVGVLGLWDRGGVR
jgi:hypothetical protein